MLERLRVAQLRLAAVALIVMMGVTLLDVLLRYLFNIPSAAPTTWSSPCW